MARKVGIAETTAKTIANRPPRLLIIAGATGTGKSTVAMKLGAKSNFARLLSTDAIREVLRAADDNSDDPALHRSSFSIGESNDAVIDWIETCRAVERGIEATINRALREGIDLLLEGVHIIPSDRLIRDWIDSGGIAVGVVMAVSDETKHQSSGPVAAKYLETLQRSNEQLVKLAGLISKKETVSVDLSSHEKEELYDLINKEE